MSQLPPLICKHSLPVEQWISEDLISFLFLAMGRWAKEKRCISVFLQSTREMVVFVPHQHRVWPFSLCYTLLLLGCPSPRRWRIWDQLHTTFTGGIGL